MKTMIGSGRQRRGKKISEKAGTLSVAVEVTRIWETHSWHHGDDDDGDGDLEWMRHSEPHDDDGTLGGWCTADPLILRIRWGPPQIHKPERIVNEAQGSCSHLHINIIFLLVSMGAGVQEGMEEGISSLAAAEDSLGWVSWHFIPGCLCPSMEPISSTCLSSWIQYQMSRNWTLMHSPRELWSSQEFRPSQNSRQQEQKWG